MFRSVEALCGHKPAPRGGLEGVEVVLSNLEHWQKFSQNVTEMIVTRAGRNLFPKLEYTVTGLEPEALYTFYIQIVRVDDFRYKFNEGKWSPVGRGEAPVPGSDRFVPHQDGSWAPGFLWMKSPVSFDRLKLTNDPQSKSAAFVPLSSMHKYQPILHIYKHASSGEDASKMHRSFAFEEAHFVAVTAYQNQKIIDLKKEHNKYAKGCRKRQSASPEEEPPEKIPSKQPFLGAIATFPCWNPLSLNPYFVFP
ncbi:hypothetical protein QR680_013372 [Steinernema hermaphroditum]|uniref:T-box domain-containing protein n=1 Tax=Steinernema hermaphroditum TaxID=289476 RepID=A0AA39I7D5_9BILA|nr:hypothetical protein QR680_013372 [Steinernema hermaphroditum]